MKKIFMACLGILTALCLTVSSPLNINAATKTTSETITFDSKWKYGEFAKITSGTATLYKVNSANAKNKTVCINAGHGTKGGTAVKVLCHPDGSPKIISGSTKAGATEAVAVGGGMTFKNGTSEAAATLKVALATKEALLAAGYNVLMIRESADVQLDNIARTLIANNNADIHIAIHYDGDGTSSDKGVFFCSIPDVASYKNMEPVKTMWPDHTLLGECAVDGLVLAGMKKWSTGKLPMDLTQTSFSTIPSIDLEVGNQCSDLSDSTMKKIASGILAGVDSFFSQKTDKAENPITVSPKTKTFSEITLAEKTKSFRINVINAAGTVSFKAANKASKSVLTVSSDGKVTIKKGTPAGTYKVKVKASGNERYEAKKIIISIRIK